MKLPTTILAAVSAVLLLAGGCDNGSGPSLRDDFEELSRERTQLKRQVQKLRADNKELAGRVTQLAGMTPGARLEALPQLARIELGRRTGIYDTDDDGRKDKLVVHIRPYDETADTVKAPGIAKLQLWDLGGQVDGAKLGQWEVGAAELKGAWASTFLTNYYRLSFDVGNLIAGHEGDLTLYVTFTDYIGGKVLNAQTVIKQ
ncbi:MAG: FtsB/FtsL family cell division protein [Planctomycetota bacterium]|jgi:outer membrane murein-binding lipoprotein Lpp